MTKEDKIPYIEVQEAWNMVAEQIKTLKNVSRHLSKCRSMSETRRASIRNRWKDRFWRENWREALIQIVESDFLLGRNEWDDPLLRGRWRPNIIWFLRRETVLKLMEDFYTDLSPHRNGKKPSYKSDFDPNAHLTKTLAEAFSEIILNTPGFEDWANNQMFEFASASKILAHVYKNGGCSFGKGIMCKCIVQAAKESGDKWNIPIYPKSLLRRNLWTIELPQYIVRAMAGWMRLPKSWEGLFEE